MHPPVITQRCLYAGHQFAKFTIRNEIPEEVSAQTHLKNLSAAALRSCLTGSCSQSVISHLIGYQSGADRANQDLFKRIEQTGLQSAAQRMR